MNTHHLVLGGAKSGKTAFAERLALAGADKPVYLATGRAWDNEMRQRIAAHKAERGNRFLTREEPIELVRYLEQSTNTTPTILIDCLTLWITNLMMAERSVAKEVDGLAHWLSRNSAPRVILVSTEVGQGIIPDNAAARAFVDHAGQSHRKLANVCAAVSFITAGLQSKLKG